MDEQEDSLTPDELDHLLSDLQTGEEVAKSFTSADVIFLNQLVNTARSTELSGSVSARLDFQIRQALTRKPLPRSSFQVSRNPGWTRFVRDLLPAAPLFRHLALTLASTALFVAFIVLSMVTWSSTGQSAHATAFTPSLSDNSLIQVPAHTITSREMLETGIANQGYKETTESTTRATIALRAIQAPSPPSTPIPGAMDGSSFSVTSLKQ
jgi:hypothetical protein